MANRWGNSISEITEDGDCSHEIKRHLLLGKKVMTKLDSMLKSRDITLPTKVHIVKAIFFPLVMYRCESWTVKKAERKRIDGFELWCWRRLLRVPWTARSNQSILKKIKRDYIKKQRHYFVNKGPSSQGYGFSSSHVWIWDLDYQESWALKSWCFWTVVLEKTLQSPLDSKEIKPVNPKGNQSWIFIGRTVAEVPILWPPDEKSWLIGKKTWCWEILKTGGEGDDRGWDG